MKRRQLHSKLPTTHTKLPFWKEESNYWLQLDVLVVLVAVHACIFVLPRAMPRVKSERFLCCRKIISRQLCLSSILESSLCAAARVLLHSGNYFVLWEVLVLLLCTAAILHLAIYTGGCM